MAHHASDDPPRRLAPLRETVQMILDEAERQGATAAEAGASSRAGLEVGVRLGEVETVEHTRDNGLGVTVYFGHRKGSASTSDMSPQALREAVAAACAIARYTQEDPCAALADAGRMCREVSDLDLYHPWPITPEQAIELAIACEDAARHCDPRITNSEGASLSSYWGLQVYGNSHGFIGGYPTTRHGLSCSVIGEDGHGMQRDHWWSSARAPQDLDEAAAIGRRAAERTLARLGARPITTRQAPVLFQAEVASGLMRHLIGAIQGASLYRRASFLVDRLGERIFPSFVRIHEEPHRPRGLSSAPFDGDGVATAAKDLVRDGVLQSYVLDSYAARKLGMETTGNAGGVRNLMIDMGSRDRNALLAEMGSGLLVTELMGQGVNTVTGDYSRGAAGFWVENGTIQFPVEEITIAGNLETMFAGLVAVGNDCDYSGSTRTGSWLIDRMTIAGQ
ncbi:metalloprotease PmbA [Thioalkalicoccus limnaeus]|uniref:Metalloprotease PmbA n=1 Tax=Thioalkalicoccus limnaeus TaxID=120681 RepID=A0ABV4BJK5_9GAMM